MYVIRAPRAVATAVVATVLLPLTLCSCAAAVDTPSQAAELRAARDSNLLELPAIQTYELTDFAITAPSTLAKLAQVAGSGLSYSGYIVLSDSIITDAEFDFSLANVQSARFVLTEPSTLRRAENETGPAYAVGELTIGDQLPVAAMVKFTPTLIDEQQLAFDIDIDLPSELPFAQNSELLQDLTASIKLTAQA